MQAETLANQEAYPGFPCHLSTPSVKLADVEELSAYRPLTARLFFVVSSWEGELFEAIRSPGQFSG